MPIIAKNIVVGEVVVESAPPPQSKHINIFEKLRQQSQPVVEKIEQKIEAPPEKYHNVRDGELHKMINKKSEYLNDMIGFKL